MQVWKFPKGINAKDLKARLAESRQAETLSLPGEMMTSSERVPTVSSATGSQRGAPGQLPGRQGQLRQSLLVPGRESPRWLSQQQVETQPTPMQFSPRMPRKLCLKQCRRNAFKFGDVLMESMRS